MIKILKNSFAIFCAAAFFSRQCLAATDFVATNAGDGSSGSFTGVMGLAASGDVVSFNTGIGSLSIGSGASSIALSHGVTIRPGDSSVSIPHALSLASAGSSLAFDLADTLDGSSHDVAVSGVVSGAGGVSAQSGAGGGVLTLSGANTYTGGTTLNGAKALSVSLGNASALGTGALTVAGGDLGTVVAGAGGTLANAIVLNGALAFDADGQTSTLTGVVSGASGLTLKGSNGGGAFILSGANTYTGGTTIDDTQPLTVDFRGADAFGSGALTVTGSDRGVLQSGRGGTLANAIVLNKNIIFDENDNDTTLSGVISGSGALTFMDFTGGGNATLSGANTYTGGTTLSGVPLSLGGDNALGSGSLTVSRGSTLSMQGYSQSVGAVSNSGTINTGAGTLAGSSYSGAGALTVQLQSGAKNLTATGNISLGGGALTISAAPGAGAYDFLHAGGALSGTFGSVAAPAHYTDSISYGATDAVVTLVFDGLTTPGGLTGTQSALLPGLDAAIGGDSAVAAELSALSPAQLADALDHIAPKALVAMHGLGFSGAGVQTGAVSQRLAALADPGGQRYEYFATQGGAIFPGTLVAEAPGDIGRADYIGPTGRGSSADSPWGAYLSGLGNVGRLDSKTGPAGNQPGYTYATGGVSGGVDYRFNENFAAGVTSGWVNGSAGLTDGSAVGSQSVRYGVYGAAFDDAWRGDLYAGGAEDFYDTSRNTTLGAAHATPQGRELNLMAQISHDVRTDWGRVAPFVELAYDRLIVNPYGEQGAGVLDLNVGRQGASSLRSTLGARWSRRFAMRSGRYDPYLSAGWQHEYDSQSRAIDAQFVAGGGAAGTQTADVARDAAQLGLGLSADWGHGVSARLGYEADVRSDFINHGFTGDLRFVF